MYICGEIYLNKDVRFPKALGLPKKTRRRRLEGLELGWMVSRLMRLPSTALGLIRIRVGNSLRVACHARHRIDRLILARENDQNSLTRSAHMAASHRWICSPLSCTVSGERVKPLGISCLPSRSCLEGDNVREGVGRQAAESGWDRVKGRPND
jgi:hypothetical protein